MHLKWIKTKNSTFAIVFQKLSEFADAVGAA
jgi:hypothetical protein